MVDTSQIQQVISKARRRLRLQAALEVAITASIPAFAGALLTVYAVRSQWVSEAGGVVLLAACAGVIALGALLGALRRFPTHVVATRIDRASGLSDRLATACAFADELRRGAEPAQHAETLAFMEAAVRDAVRAVPRADVAAATPFRQPRDARAAAAFAVVATLAAGVYWTGESQAGPGVGLDGPAIAGEDELKPKNPVQLDDDDLDYTRELLQDLRQTAMEEQEPTLDEFVKSVEDLLDKAERGELTKEQLLEELKKAEEKFMDGADSEEMEKAMSDLEDTGRELQKNELTVELGKALDDGDLDKAQKEFEKLAEKLENGQLSEKQKQELAKALEKAADKFMDKEQKRDKERDQQIQNAERELEKMQRRLDQAKSETEKNELKRRMEKKKRELKQLQRDKEQQDKSAQKRSLKRLHRNMKKAAENLKKKDQDQDQQQQNERMASQDLKSASEDTGQVDADRRKMAAQKKVATQLNDLKEALRRARRQGQRGPQDLFGKNKRNQDFQRRARGGQGQKGAWRPGQGQGQGKGQQPGGQQPGGPGQQPGGQQWGTGHDPDLMGDPTAKGGHVKDEQVSGVHGQGPSRRETILAAAQKGFASRAYKNVYQRYKTIVEEVIRAEKVPAGYKYYVKKYFQKIKPHAM